MSKFVESRLLHRYLVVQAVAIATFTFVPSEGWIHLVWQVGVGWASAAFVVVGMRRQGSLAWYALAAGVFLNATGLLVEHVGETYFHQTENPNLSDVFFIGLYPSFVIGLGSLVWSRSATEGSLSLMMDTLVSTLAVTGLSLVAWEFIVWQTQIGPGLPLMRQLVAVAYPLGDLMILALIARLFLGGVRTAAFVLVMLAMCLFLAADIGWAVFLGQRVDPAPEVRRMLEMVSMSAFSLIGAAALHPSVRRIVPPQEDGPLARAHVRWVALVLAIATAPAVILAQALLDHRHSINGF